MIKSSDEINNEVDKKIKTIWVKKLWVKQMKASRIKKICLFLIS